jgi:protein-L-isoaspartate(D-aspartate) O-methyltransferase
MFSEAELAVVRRAYAKQILAAARVNDHRVEAAFANIRREDYLAPGPWPILRYEVYVPSPDANPVYLYSNILVGIIPERKLNNGEPAFHARLIAAAAPAEGEHVIHVGPGTGYYTAILADLVGVSGRVTAIEFDPQLARRAAENFRSDPRVEVVQGDGAIMPLAPADVVYVNAGATRPMGTWLDALNDGGRLILPLSTSKGFDYDGPPLPILKRGAVFRIEKQHDGFAAKCVSGVSIIPCESARDEISETALAAALARGGSESVTRLYRHNEVSEEEIWLKAPGWCLATR